MEVPPPPALRTVECRLSLAGPPPIALPIPPSSPAQTVDNVSVASSDVPVARYDSSSLTTFLEFPPGPDGSPREIALTCRIRRNRATVPVTPEEARRYAAATEVFRNQLALFEPDDSIGERVAAILGFLHANVRLNEDPLSAFPDPARALRDKEAGPGDLAALFVQLCRAAGVPARLVVGVELPSERIPSSMPANDLDYRAQFLSEDSFWVTVDVADAMRLERNPESAFKETDSDFLDLAVDPSGADASSAFLFPGSGASVTLRREISFRDVD